MQNFTLNMREIYHSVSLNFEFQTQKESKTKYKRKRKEKKDLSPALGPIVMGSAHLANSSARPNSYSARLDARLCMYL